MKNLISWIGLALIFSLASNANAWKKNKSQSNYKYSSAACDWVSDSDGIIPVPFDIFNRTVELAHDQIYALEGKVFYLSGRPYIDIDLEKHPWLGQATRKSNPSYPLLNSDVKWSHYKYKKVRVIVRAKGVIEEDDYGDRRYQIYLEPIVLNQ